MINKCKPHIRAPRVILQWTKENFGFGELYFYLKDGQVHCDNECMDKDTIKEILCSMVDICILDDLRGDSK